MSWTLAQAHAGTTPSMKTAFPPFLTETLACLGQRPSHRRKDYLRRQMVNSRFSKDHQDRSNHYLNTRHHRQRTKRHPLSARQYGFHHRWRHLK